MILRRVDAAAKIDVSKGIDEIRKLDDPIGDANGIDPGSPDAFMVNVATVQLELIFRSWLVNAFDWPFYTAAIAALLGLAPALMLPRRLAPQDEAEDDVETADGST